MTTDEQGHEKSNTALYERKPNPELWKKAQELSRGNAKNKLDCLEILFKRQYELPKESSQLATELVGADQPKEIKLAAAKFLSDSPHIPTGMFHDVLSALSKDSDKEVSAAALEVMKSVYAPMMYVTEKYYKSSICHLLNFSIPACGKPNG